MRKNQKLDTAFAYQDKSGNWYMKLTYAYEDEKGLHKVIFPKVEFPFVTRGIPFPYKLDEWHTLCDWIESLPYSELITGCEK